MAVDTRQKNVQWNVLTEEGEAFEGTYDHAHLAVLMDIRDELQTLNRLLGCQNFVQVPAMLRGIRRDLKARKDSK